MKKLLTLTAALFLLSFAAKADVTVNNNTGCPFNFWITLVEPHSCGTNSITIGPITLPPGTTTFKHGVYSFCQMDVAHIAGNTAPCPGTGLPDGASCDNPTYSTIDPPTGTFWVCGCGWVTMTITNDNQVDIN